MCAGLGFYIAKINQEEIEDFYSKKEIEQQLDDKILMTYFWQQRPCLPIEEKDKVHLYDWGNRDDKQLKMPKTGWCRLESLQAGKWDWLNPVQVHVPALKGYEKKKWFLTPQGLEAVLVKHQGQKRAYLLTQPSSRFYEKLTGHDRMPIGKIERVKSKV